jgi:hypothetical protein
MNNYKDNLNTGIRRKKGIEKLMFLELGSKFSS